MTGKSLRSGFRAALLAGMAFSLAGCGGVGAISEPVRSSPGLGSLAIFGNPQNIPKAESPEDQPDRNCPAVSVMEGGAAHRVGRAGSNEVSHQASLIDVARECRYGAGQLSMKIGIQGRMLIGSLGKAGSYSVPVRVAIKRNDTVVATRVARVSATIPAGETSVAFVHVEDNMVVPLSATDPADEYDVYVGFDSGGAADPRKGRRRR